MSAAATDLVESLFERKDAKAQDDGSAGPLFDATDDEQEEAADD